MGEKGAGGWKGEKGQEGERGVPRNPLCMYKAFLSMAFTTVDFFSFSLFFSSSFLNLFPPTYYVYAWIASLIT